MQTEYAVVARVRAKELGTRLAIGVFLALSAYFLAPSIWPAAWFAVMCMGQAIDAAAFKPFRTEDAPPPTRRQEIVCAVVAGLNTAVYSAIAAYMFLRGGEAGKMFCMVQCAGGLLHVCLHMHFARTLLFAAAAPHAAYLLGLPVYAAVFGSGSGSTLEPLPATVVVIGGMLYIAHLVAAVRQSSATMAALRTANEGANIERARAERASAAKSDFLATVSHEIRTPMNAVLSAANLLKRTSLTPEQTEHVSMLLHAGDVLMGLLNDVLDLSKIEAGKMTAEEADLDIVEKLEGLALLWAPRAQANGVSLTLDVEPSMPSRVRTDPLRLQQILFNLLSNAVKFTETGAITLRAGSGGACLWFEVEDTGCGVEPESLERLFGSFEQAEAATTRRHGGTGLGLAISRRLAILLGGSLTARSAPGYGSCFRLEVPLLMVAERLEETAATAAQEEQRPLSVLVAEDHEVNQRILTLFLEPLGWRITQAWNGQEAVEAAAIEPFDVIIMDMQMPILDGLQAAAAIRTGGGPNADTPIVALTAAALDHHKQAWARIGVADFLTKPIQPQLLIATLAAAAAGAADEAVQAAA